MNELLLYFNLTSKRTPITANFMEDLEDNYMTVWFGQEDAIELYNIFSDTIGTYYVRCSRFGSDTYTYIYTYVMSYEDYEILLGLFKLVGREITC